MTATNAHRATPKPYLIEGYAAGSTDEGTWFTVWGSAYDNRLVFATYEEGEQRAELLRSRTIESLRSSVVIRRVRRGHHSDAYQIINETS